MADKAQFRVMRPLRGRPRRRPRVVAFYLHAATSTQKLLRAPARSSSPGTRDRVARRAAIGDWPARPASRCSTRRRRSGPGVAAAVPTVELATAMPTRTCAAGGGKGVGGILGFKNKAHAGGAQGGRLPEPATRATATWRSGIRAQHRKQDVACSDCHSLHGTPGPGSTIALKKPNPDGRALRDHRAPARVRDLHLVPPPDPLAAHQALAPPDHRRQGVLQQLPQPARRALQGDGQGRVDPAALHHLPRREARPVRLGSPAGRGELPDLPQLARLEPRAAARREGAQRLPGLPRRLAPPRHDLRRERRLEPAAQRRPTRGSSRAAASTATTTFTAATLPRCAASSSCDRRRT